MRLLKSVERFVKNAKPDITVSGDIDKRILDDSFAAMEETIRAKPALNQPNIWRIIMKTKTVRLTAAAVIIIAALIGINYFGFSMDGSSVAWADVVGYIVVAETAEFDLTLESGGQSEQQTSHIVCMAPGRIRQTMPDGSIHIINFEQNKILLLNTNEQKATLKELVAESGELSQLDVFGNMQKRLEDMIHFADDSVETLDREIIDGREAAGFRIRLTQRDKIMGWQGKGTFTVWADLETKLPVRWESYDEMYGINTIVSNIELNLEVDEMFFDTAIPPDYEVKTERNVYGAGTETVNQTWIDEAKIIEGFRSWTTISKGKFPSSLTFDAIKDFNPEASIGLKQVGWGFNVDIKGLSAADFFGEYEPTQEELVELNSNLNKALSGVQAVFFLPAQSDWHYAGKDIKFGDADTAIFWYRPTDSETYRVIYGDLSVIDVASEDLPK